MANPYIGNNPYTSQVADIGYPQVNYQSSPQDTRMQEQFHSQALQQMQQMGQQQPAPTSAGINPLALAQALKGFKKSTPIANAALTSGMNGPIGSPVGLGSGPSGYGLGTGSTAGAGLNMFPIFGG